jgi:magnesium-transporting ATPase (P-type)
MFRIGIFSNPWVLVGSGIMIVLQLLYTYAPFMNKIFQSAPIAGRDWVIIVVIALAVYGIIGVEKWLRQRIYVRAGNKHAA